MGGEKDDEDELDQCEEREIRGEWRRGRDQDDNVITMECEESVPLPPDLRQPQTKQRK